MWNPTTLIEWQEYNRLYHSFYKWLRSNPVVEWRSYSAEYRPRLVRRCSRELVRKFKRGY
jgi:hypothetical protein